MKQVFPLSLGLTVLLIGGAWAADPLRENLMRLEKRIQTGKPAPAPAPRPRSTPRRVVRTPAPKPAPKKPAAQTAARPAAPSTVSVAYSKERIGVKGGSGDLVVTASPGSTTHVYFRQQLVSDGGDGAATIPDVPPGKYPVLFWAPDKGKRKTYWVTVRPGVVAAVKATL